ncbi:MAG: chemotaxis protein CheX [Magnetococcales bacterium]|nr:chemotaxis protein CheX [Magnetococcales bacterium]
MKKELLTAVEESVMEIVETMLFIEVDPGVGVAKPSGVQHIPAQAEASVIVGLSGSINGGVRLACSVNVAKFLAGSLAMDQFKSLNSDAKDAFAELGNMIAGGVQTRLVNKLEELGEVDLTPPTVIVGEDYDVEYKSNLESVRYFFRVNKENFLIEVFFLENTRTQVSVELDTKSLIQLDDLAKERGKSRSVVIKDLIENASA